MTRNPQSHPRAQFLDLEAGVSPGRWSSDEEVPEEEDGYEPSFIDKEGVSEQVMIMNEPLRRPTGVKRHYKIHPIRSCQTT